MTTRADSLSLTRMTPALGAIVAGIDLSIIPSKQAVELMTSALDEHLVLFFRGQRLTPRQQRDFTAQFGLLYAHPFYPGAQGAVEVMILDYDEHRKSAQNAWHADVTFIETPPHIEILFGEIIPPTGGDTLWASMYTAYEALSLSFRQLLDGLYAVHDFAKDFPPARFLASDVTPPSDVYKRHPPVVHPVVRTNTATGRKGLFVNASFTTYLQGMSRRESDAILAFLFEHLQQPEFHVRWHWQCGDVVMWDNRWTQHYAVSDYFPLHRRVHRVSVLGDRPV